ncbi:hypothetical protein [uncultured Microbacterium sp.]|uniref:hypothetical protein n=1 Tax=uncultured Microbacterium sp. TaxID=191216 RepID=UPI002619C4EB|nr:hypothetical protein [uncultured Microbacterium sp.]
MAESQTASERAALVPGAHRVIRALEGSEGPFRGRLLTSGDAVVVGVAAEELEAWPGWEFSGEDHVCGVSDVLRRPDGHDALVPWCVHRVETFLGKRRVAQCLLAPGEMGTLVVSLLRGLRALGAADATAVGDWWITAEGRPVFAHGDGAGARMRTGQLMVKIAEHTTDRSSQRILEEIITALGGSRHRIDDDSRWESELFSTAAPRPLRLDVFGPERAADLGVPGWGDLVVTDNARASRQALRQERSRDDGARGSRALWAAARGRAMALTAVLARSRDQRREAQPNRSERASVGHGRRRSLILAGVLAVGVLTVGLAWPQADPDDPNTRISAPEKLLPAVDEDESLEIGESGAQEQEKSPAPVGKPGATEGHGELMTTLPALLSALHECRETGETSCSAAIAEGSTMPMQGLATRGPAASSPSLVDDYGDVAVVRLTPLDPGSAETDAVAEVAEQMLVLERRDEKWLVRDVYDVAHQPE